MASFATIAQQADAAKKEPSTLKTVQLDGQVVLKILQHCNEALPHLVTGQLLGLDVGQTLEVTDCFAFPVSQSMRARAVHGGWNGRARKLPALQGTPTPHVHALVASP